jgi:hypothetical protein
MFWDITLCSSLIADVSIESIDFRQTTERYSPEETAPQGHSCENLTSIIAF